jgi:hypothetical protein
MSIKNNFSLECVTYGCGNVFDPNKWNPIKNRLYFNKPDGGLWASPFDTTYGWIDWCKDENFGDLSTLFKFLYSGNTIIIDSKDDLLDLPFQERPQHKKNSSGLFGFKVINFQSLANFAIDGIYLTHQGESETRYLHGLDGGLYGWECECILIMNKNSILPK